jgi:hypothetical protein
MPRHNSRKAKEGFLREQNKENIGNSNRGKAKGQGKAKPGDKSIYESVLEERQQRHTRKRMI